jgi:hypothetical protein
MTRIVGGLGELHATVDSRPDRDRWIPRRLQEPSLHRADLTWRARTRVLPYCAPAVPYHRDGFRSQLESHSGKLIVNVASLMRANGTLICVGRVERGHHAGNRG